MSICLTLFLSYPCIHILTSFWHCNAQTHVHITYNKDCDLAENLFYGIVAIFASLGVIAMSCFGMFVYVLGLSDANHVANRYADASVSSGWMAFFNIDRGIYLVFECGSLLLCMLLSRVVYVWQAALLPSLLIVQSSISLLIVAMDMPFYRTSANCLSIGWLLARAMTSILNIITISVNTSDEIGGFVISGVTLGSVPVWTCVGFALGYVLTRFVIFKANVLELSLRNNEMPTVSSRYLINALRITCRNEKQRSAYERAILQLCQTKYENSELYLMLATTSMYFKRDAATMPLLYLKKAMTLRPNVLRKFCLFVRNSEYEMQAGDQSDTRKIHKILEQVKKHDARTIFFAKQFWKETLEKNMNISKMSTIANQLEHAVSGMLNSAVIFD